VNKMKKMHKNFMNFSLARPGEFDEMTEEEWKERIDSRVPLLYNVAERVYRRPSRLDYWIE
jgi:hypothetical protein